MSGVVVGIRRIAGWPGWPLAVALDAALSSVSIALGHEWPRWAVAFMVAMSAAGWALLWLRARRLRGES